jgi:hemolysin III
VLIALSPSTPIRWAAAVYTLTALLLFAGSALLHRGNWSPPVRAHLRRIDHANIFLLIAGSYTPFTLILLEGTDRVVLLSVVWGGALLGVIFRVFWLKAPRWLYVALYLVLGWAATFYLPAFVQAAGTAVLVLIIVGGGLYTLGGVVYGLKRPNPLPNWFGFHEVFHAFTIAAFVVHYVGISIAAYTAP